MSTRRVPLWQQPRSFTTVEDGATRGAVIGRNVWNDDGSLFEPAAAATPAQGNDVAVTLWRLVREIPLNVKALELSEGAGLFAVTGAGTGAFRTLADTETIGWTNGDGVAGNPAASLKDLADSGAGTFKLLTRDTYGRLSGTKDGTTSDVPEGSNLYHTAARVDARIDAQKGVAGGLATLDASAKLDSGQLPALAITETFVVADEAAMLALTCEQGDVAVRTDISTSFILTAEPASTLSNWQELLTPTAGAVTSFNGRTGAVVPASGDYTAAQVGADPAGTAAAIVTQTIADGDTTHAPSGDAVFDALAGKVSFPADRVVVSGNYTAVLEDEGCIVRFNSTSAQTFTIPPSSSVAFPIGSTLGVFQNNTGATTVAAGAGVTLRGLGGGAVSPSAQFGCVIYRKYLPDNWLVVSAT